MAAQVARSAKGRAVLAAVLRRLGAAAFALLADCLTAEQRRPRTAADLAADKADTIPYLVPNTVYGTRRLTARWRRPMPVTTHLPKMKITAPRTARTGHKRRQELDDRATTSRALAEGDAPATRPGPCAGSPRRGRPHTARWTYCGGDVPIEPCAFGLHLGGVARPAPHAATAASTGGAQRGQAIVVDKLCEGDLETRRMSRAPGLQAGQCSPLGLRAPRASGWPMARKVLTTKIPS